MELNVWERMKLLYVLPEKSDFVTLKIARKLREALSFSEEELAELDFHKDGDRVMWNPQAAIVKEIQIGPKATEIIVAALKAVSEAKELDEQTVMLFEKFADTTEYDLGGEA